MFVALGIQRKMRMRLIVICGVCGSAIFIVLFLTKDNFFGGKKLIEHKMCVGFYLQTWSEKLLIMRRIEERINKTIQGNS